MSALTELMEVAEAAAPEDYKKVMAALNRHARAYANDDHQEAIRRSAQWVRARAEYAARSKRRPRQTRGGAPSDPGFLEALGIYEELARKPAPSFLTTREGEKHVQELLELCRGAMPRSSRSAPRHHDATEVTMTLPVPLSELRFPKALNRRLHELLDRQDDGEVLSEEERAEAEGLVEVAELLSILRMRAEAAARSDARG